MPPEEVACLDEQHPMTPTGCPQHDLLPVRRQCYIPVLWRQTDDGEGWIVHAPTTRVARLDPSTGAGPIKDEVRRMLPRMHDLWMLPVRT